MMRRLVIQALVGVCVAHAAHRAIAARPEDPTPATPPTPPAPATPASVRRVEMHRVSGCWTLTLSNGVTATIRPMPASGRAVVWVLLAGTELGETQADRGVTQAVGSSWTLPGAKPEAQQGPMPPWAGAMGGVRISPTPEGLVLRFDGTAADIEGALSRIERLLAQPTIDPDRFAAWSASQVTLKQQIPRLPARTMAEAMRDLIWPMNLQGAAKPPPARQRPVTLENVQALTAASVQAHVSDWAAHLPVHVAIAGELTLPQAQAMVSRTLGNLPARPALSPATFREQRVSDRPAGPLLAERTAEGGAADIGGVQIALAAPDLTDLKTLRTTYILSRVVKARMVRVLADAGQRVGLVSCVAVPGRLYPGTGIVLLTAHLSGSVDDVRATSRLLHGVLDEMAGGAVSEEEVALAREDLAREVEQRLREPEYWAPNLELAAFYGLELDDLPGAAASYRAVSAADVVRQFKSLSKPAEAYEIRVLPTPMPAALAPPAQP